VVEAFRADSAGPAHPIQNLEGYGTARSTWFNETQQLWVGERALLRTVSFECHSRAA